MGLASANLDTQIALLATAAALATVDGVAEAILLDTIQIEKIAEADTFIDTTQTPWELVFIERGTGVIGVGTELFRKTIKDTAGGNITATTAVPGQLEDV